MGNYRADDLARVEAALSDHQTLTFVRPQDVANRPHMRFDGRTLSEIGDQRWRTRRTTRSDTSCVVVKAGRERRVEAGHERRLGADTSRASAWRRYCSVRLFGCLVGSTTATEALYPVSRLTTRR